MRALLFTALALPLLCAGPAFGQDAPAAAPALSPAPTQATPPAELGAAPSANGEEETVVVRGYRDRALDAYLRGDFETAEREFDENLSCIQRVETLREFAFQQAQANDLRSEINLGSIGSSGAATTTAPPQSSYTAHNRRTRVPERTCNSPYWQIYMMGLSQLGQGNYDEAKETLYRVVRESNHQYMFDAHYRVGLLELMDGNIDEANARLTHLRRMQRLCNRRGTSCEIKGELDYDVAQLEHWIEISQRGS